VPRTMPGYIEIKPKIVWVNCTETAG